MKKGLVLEGGGILGVSYVGYYQYMYENKIKYDYIIGSSIGSLIGAIMCCRPEPKWVTNQVMKKYLPDLIDNKWGVIEGLYNLGDYGWYSGKNVEKWTDSMLEELTGVKGITFEKMYEVTKVYLCITSYSVDEGKTVYYNVDTSPDLRVATAVMRSTALPILYKMVEGKWMDGGMLDNFPVNWMANNKIPFDGIKLIKKGYKITKGKPENWTQYSKLILSLLQEQLIKMHVEDKHWKHVAKIDVTGFSTIEFNLTNLQKEMLIHRGFSAAEKYYESQK
jgi:NTE family protein